MSQIFFYMYIRSKIQKAKLERVNWQISLSSLLCFVFYDKWILHSKFAPTGQTVTAQYYKKASETKGHHSLKGTPTKESWKLQYDNALAYNYRYDTLPHPDQPNNGFLSNLQFPPTPGRLFCSFDWNRGLNDIIWVLWGTSKKTSTALLKDNPAKVIQKACTEWTFCRQKCIDVHFEEY